MGLESGVPQVLLISEVRPGLPKVGRVYATAEIGDSGRLGEMLQEMDRRCAVENSPKKYSRTGYRLEEVRTANGLNVNLYVYYDPMDDSGREAGGQLQWANPRNLNGAEQAVLGQVIEGSALGDIGLKEQKF